ncbi:hypothetical protein KM1_179880 [Entamoeba histolytica HM-3:IMSS]|uniref:Uncharacterized protein n=5 Tax=Entamoeba histolytica TaxID=5759 RepID=B1N2X1_ENTH1|nr:hypothetical protein EHI_073520 [Entamoeba histolytica HM-1:IMSS]EMD47550.1 Hypothetical protein EHI5A_105360 [Entamoeba histolytica KU27]EMS14914.1 hypothetical protein KM1_179880 [Entamoeba histolytica HM-3:IMSS]ENY64144.1 hypothetical protein EHI7A_178560 [Entamoeba histolytica HM-1:IMSS-A]GAT93500.1 hypothetical protein CL6EHI_073520 [Entamoeba histolytica]EDS89690.1 hypothetical protein EHI_073520 [Entamoeba histolytica HM-1:IMSS]|eukprot:XP_001913537.1 hypothetical protein EHI_073520 [Entamoeba histolytica HM-1:IMSS]
MLYPSSYEVGSYSDGVRCTKVKEINRYYIYGGKQLYMVLCVLLLINLVDVLHVKMDYKQNHCCDVCYKTHSTCDNSTLCVSCQDELTQYNRGFCRGFDPQCAESCK